MVFGQVSPTIFGIMFFGKTLTAVEGQDGLGHEKI